MIKAWSYSRWQTWKTCPFKAKLKYIEKLKEPAGEPLLRGSRIHKKGEDYVAGKLKRLPTEYKSYAAEMKGLRAIHQKVDLELELAFTKSWVPCGWFDRSAWARAKLDVVYTDDLGVDVVIDYKTGKIRPENITQLDLYAAMIYADNIDTLDKVRAEFWYLDHGETVVRNYTPTECERAKREWVGRVKPMLADRTFKPTPSNACRWCHFKKNNGGPCEF